MKNNTILQEMRQALHISLQKVADKVGIAASTIYYAENDVHELGQKKYARLVAYYEDELTKRKMRNNF